MPRRVCLAVLWQRIGPRQAGRSCGARSRGLHRPHSRPPRSLPAHRPRRRIGRFRTVNQEHRATTRERKSQGGLRSTSHFGCPAEASQDLLRRTPLGLLMCQRVSVSESQLRRSRWRGQSRRERKAGARPGAQPTPTAPTSCAAHALNERAWMLSRGRQRRSGSHRGRDTPRLDAEWTLAHPTIERQAPKSARFAGTFRDGSDGTRTRDLRRDRPAF